MGILEESHGSVPSQFQGFFSYPSNQPPHSTPRHRSLTHSLRSNIFLLLEELRFRLLTHWMMSIYPKCSSLTFFTPFCLSKRGTLLLGARQAPWLVPGFLNPIILAHNDCGFPLCPSLETALTFSLGTVLFQDLLLTSSRSLVS